MSAASQYDYKKIQEKWIERWDQRGYFHSEPNPDRAPFSVAIPPPNVTGALHLGHALNDTLQDVMIRLKRMQGYETLWLPGADHAGIATQAVVERKLFEEEGKTRNDIGRDELVRRIWAWKDDYERRIIQQLKAMGASCDWPRWRFTLDEQCARAVRECFFRMFRDGLIYRGKRLVNWDVQLQTAVADDEVYHEEVDGHLWHFRYPIEGTGQFVEIATTRPETMLGDTAVAVHPDDARYKQVIDKHVRLPLMDRLIPVIADGQLVNPEFGTGCVKVTPAHDPNDYACGLRHGLQMINLLTPDGRINASGGKYSGMTIAQARKAVVSDLEHLGLVSKVETYRHAVGHSDRSKTAIEPYLSDQWFIRMSKLAERAMSAVRDGEIRIHPPRYADAYLRWLGEKRDWCISRQLWWGHQIPIWYGRTCDEADLRKAFADRSDVVWRYDTQEQQWLICSLRDVADSVVAGHILTRDPDVLDTWFSSALWPHSTLGWPESTAELQYYYPTSLLSTAREIITLWVARMVIMSQYNLGVVPFRDVYIHPVVQDGRGMPMKKSLGNGVDPFDIIEKYGADALRFTLTAMSTETQDVRMPVTKEKLSDGRVINTSEKFEYGRNFGTKVYNAAKLVLSNLEGFRPAYVDRAELTLEDRWLLSRLARTVRGYTQALEEYQYADAARIIYDFVWGELCDWYLEIIKPRFRSETARPLAQRVAAFVLDRTLRLLHPIIPFVTEEIWESLGRVASSRGIPEPLEAEEAIAISRWPDCDESAIDADVESQMALLQDVIRSVRNTRSLFGVAAKAELDLTIDADAANARFLSEHGDTIRLLARVRRLTCAPNAVRPARSAAHVLTGCKLFVSLAEHIDVDAEIVRQQKKLAELEKRSEAVKANLANDDFLQRARREVIDQQRQLLADLECQANDIRAIIAGLTP
jgi:valyl-tRNA synthetase